MVGMDFHHAQALGTRLSQFLAHVVEVVGVGHELLQVVALHLVGVFEDVLAEALHLLDDIPPLVVADVLKDVAHHPLQHGLLLVERLDHRVDGHLLHLLVVELDAQVGGEVELAGQVAEHALEELVDGLDAERGVVVNDARERLLGPGAHEPFADPHLLGDLLQIVVGVGVAAGQTVELAQNPHLHLFRGLVGEGHGEDVPKVERVVYQQLDIFHGESEGLAASGARLEHREWCAWVLGRL